MESTFKLLATDSKGDKESYPEMNINNEIIYPWRVTLRHKEELGKLRGVYSFEKLVSII